MEGLGSGKFKIEKERQKEEARRLRRDRIEASMDAAVPLIAKDLGKFIPLEWAKYHQEERETFVYDLWCNGSIVASIRAVNSSIAVYDYKLSLNKRWKLTEQKPHGKFVFKNANNEEMVVTATIRNS